MSAARREHVHGNDYFKYMAQDDVIDEIQTHYSRILDASSLNVADPVAAATGYFNNNQKVYADPMKLGKTVVFITRPNLNLRDARNIARSKIFSYFMTSQLGTTLMRQLMYSSVADDMYYAIYGRASHKIPLLGRHDDTIIGGKSAPSQIHTLPILKSNFIPLLSNTCTESSNGKDIILEVNETEGDFSGNRLQYAAGIDETMSIGEVTLTFDDLYYSPVMNLFNIWVMYMHYVSKGLCVPQYEYLVHRIIDYTCSIYIFMLGTDHQTILRWTRYTGAFPRSIPFGQIQHTSDPQVQALRTIQIPFAYNFACPMDPTVLTEFNMIAGPALYNRFVNIYKKTEPVKYLNFHGCTYANAMKILEEYPARINTEDKYASELPMRAISPIYDSVNLPRVTNWPDVLDESDSLDFNLVNRERGLINSGWYGSPYIVDGNRLMWL